MHRHNFELIAEYAQGSLDDDARARSLVDSCDRCRAIYNEQKSARAILGTATTAALSEHEKAALHRDIWTELRSPANVAKESGLGWWRSSWAFGAAAVIVIGVGLFGVLNSQDATVATFSEISSGLGVGQTNDLDGDGASAPTEETTSTAPLLEFGDVAAYETVTNEVRSADGTTTGYARVAALDEGTSQQQECLQLAGLDNYLALEGFETLTSLIIAVPEDHLLSVTPIVFVDPESCTIVHRED